MRWLQWGTIDFEKGLGGVEMHARCLARELRVRGVDAVISHDPAALAGDWDVIHTHGSMALEKNVRTAPGSVRLHTLHGVTWDRMKACGEWLWIGGYRAYLRESASVKHADGVLSIHDRLSLYQRAKNIGKPTRVCGNAWDTYMDPVDEPSPRLRALLERAEGRPLWLFIGRREDTVKGADLLEQMLERDSRLGQELFWIAVPGDGFSPNLGLHDSGPLNPNEIRYLLRAAQGVILPSRYEGLPWVALEALAYGTFVVSHEIGGMTTIPTGVMGLTLIPMGDFSLFSSAILSAKIGEDRTVRQTRNRELLPTWGEVARRSLELALELKRRT